MRWAMNVRSKQRVSVPPTSFYASGLEAVDRACHARMENARNSGRFVRSDGSG